MSSSLDSKRSCLSPSPLPFDSGRPRASSLPHIHSQQVGSSKSPNVVSALPTASLSTSTLVDAAPPPDFNISRNKASFLHYDRSTGPSYKKQEKVTPFQHTPGYINTRNRVTEAARKVSGNSGLVVHELLSVSTDLLRIAPVVGLAETARTLLSIWDAIQLVDTNHKGWLRLLDRCATVLLSVRLDILEAGGDAVSEELKPALDNLTMAFRDVYRTAQTQQGLPFLKRYLQREDIENALVGCHKQVDEALTMFNTSIQVRILRQVMHIEQQQRADTNTLLYSISHCNVHLDHPLTGAPSQPETHATTVIAVSSLSPTEDGYDCSGHVLAAQFQTTIGQKHDTDELRRLMRAALQTNDDTEMMRVLQVGRDEMPDAVKALQRALELASGAR